MARMFFSKRAEVGSIFDVKALPAMGCDVLEGSAMGWTLYDTGAAAASAIHCATAEEKRS